MLLEVIGRVEKRNSLSVAEKLRTWLKQLFDYAMVVIPSMDTGHRSARGRRSPATRPAQPTPDPAQTARHIDALNQWFDQLLPEQLSVGLTVANASMTANMRIASFGQRYNVVTKSLQLIRRPYPQRLPEWWQFMETTITARHGRKRWQAFAARHEAAFMASTAESGFRVRHYSAPFNYPHCLTPPALLQPMLAGFELPALPYLKAQDTSFVAHPSKTAMMPPAAKPSAKTTSVETHL